MTLPPEGSFSAPSANVTAAGLTVLLLRDQQQRWRSGERPRVEDYLARYPHLAADTDCILQLLCGEFLLRQECGQTPSLAEYRQRFPDHAEALARDLEGLAQAAAEAQAPARGVTTVYPTDGGNAHTTRLPSTGLASELPVPLPERVAVPGYEVFEVLGRGGMGIVYKALQLRLERIVALKMILHAEHASAAHRQRFLAEARAVARLQHPNIVQIHEVGEHQDLPFFSLEYCSGGTLAEKLDGTPWEATRAAELVGTLARAVQAAHEAKVVHRDLKPANVLLTADGTPKITDFGLAKHLDRPAATQTGAVIGTPSYMSPEQAGGQKEVGPAADVYALGAILYELLIGRPPFRAATPLDTVMQVASQEPVAVRRLQPAVPRDLETICHKCLEKDPKRRYESAAALAEDLRRFEVGEPLAARPVRGPARLWRWARRKPALAGLVATLLLALVGTVIGVSLFAWQAEMGRREQSKRLGQIKKANEILTSVFRDLDPEAEEKSEVPLRAQLGERLDQAAALLEGEAVGDPLAVAGLQDVLGQTLRNLGYPARAIPLHTKALRTFETQLGPDHPDTLSSMNNLASAYQDAGQLDKAVSLFEQTLERRKAKLGPDDPDTLNSMNDLARAYRDAGQLDRALPLHEQDLARSKVRLEPDDPHILTCMTNLAEAYREAGQLDKAVALHEQTLEKVKAKLGPDHSRTLISMNNLALAYRAAGQLDKAVALHEQELEKSKAKYGPDHPGTLTSMDNLAGAYQDAEQLDKALPLFEQALQKRRARLGPDHLDTLISMSNLGKAYQEAGQLDKAVPLFEQCLEKAIANLGPDHPHTLISMNNLALAYQASGRFDKAVPLHEQEVEKSKAKFGPDHPGTLTSMSNLANAYRATGRMEKALPLLEQVLQKRRTKLGPDHPRTLSSVHRLATALEETKQPDRALALWRDLLAGQSQRLSADHPDRAATLTGLGRCLLHVGKPAEAEPLLREALAVQEKKQPDAWTTFDTQSLLGGSLLEQRKYAAAEPLLLTGYQGMEKRQAKIPFPDKVYLKEGLERLIQLYEAIGKKGQAEKWRQKRAAKPGTGSL
jgi:tetratricopeptide (TPR) repeat protein